MVRKNPNKSFYHFKVNHLDDAGVVIESNRYFTLKDMVQRYQTTEYLIRQNIKCKISNRGNPLKNIQFFNEYSPVYRHVLNE